MCVIYIYVLRKIYIDISCMIPSIGMIYFCMVGYMMTSRMFIMMSCYLLCTWHSFHWWFLLSDVIDNSPLNHDSWIPILVLGVSKNRGGPPKWMVYNGKSYEQMDDLGGNPTIFGNTLLDWLLVVGPTGYSDDNVMSSWFPANGFVVKLRKAVSESRLDPRKDWQGNTHHGYAVFVCCLWGRCV